MDHPLDDTVLSGFFEETESISKTANKAKLVGKLKGIFRGKAAKGGAGGLQELAHRVQHPFEGMARGWRSMAPMADPRTKKELVSELARTAHGTRTPWYKLPALRLQSASHLQQPAGTPLMSIIRGEQGPGRVKALAEELSRRGWTGKTRATKYLPVGEKGMFTGFTAGAIPSIVGAKEPTPTGEGGTIERLLGETGGAAGWLLGTGTGGMLAPMALWYGLHRGGSAAGRILDRMRAGASLQQAAEAPTPEEAGEQLGTIAKYYGAR